MADKQGFGVLALSRRTSSAGAFVVGRNRPEMEGLVGAGRHVTSQFRSGTKITSRSGSELTTLTALAEVQQMSLSLDRCRGVDVVTTGTPGARLQGRKVRAVTMSAMGQPASSRGSRTVLSGERMAADSAMKWTPQKTMTSASVRAASKESPGSRRCCRRSPGPRRACSCGPAGCRFVPQKSSDFLPDVACFHHPGLLIFMRRQYLTGQY